MRALAEKLHFTQKSRKTQKDTVSGVGKHRKSDSGIRLMLQLKIKGYDT
jgi:hypothetical protein